MLQLRFEVRPPTNPGSCRSPQGLLEFGRDGVALGSETRRYPGVAVRVPGSTGTKEAWGFSKKDRSPAAFLSNRDPFRNP